MNKIFFLSTLIIFISCSRQNSAQESTGIQSIPQLTMASGDTVNDLGNNIMTIYQDKKNNFWFGSWEDGLYRYDGKTIIHYTTKSGLPHNRIEEIKEDKSGNVYINTSKGISKFDGQRFSTLRIDTSDRKWKLEPNDLWFKQGWDSGFVFRYDCNVLHPLTFPNTQLGVDFLSTQPNNPASPYSVYTIYKDRKGNIWFGTAAMGVCRFDGKNIDWILENDVTELHNGPSNGVRSIIEDKDGYFWFNSMYRYNVYGNSTSSFYTREKSIGSLDGKKNGNLVEYLSIARDNNNELWIATYNDGVWRYNGKDIVHYLVKNDTEDITVFSIYKDNSGDLWLGTHENGAYKFNGQTFEKFKLRP